MRIRQIILPALFLVLLSLCRFAEAGGDPLQAGFADPPQSARPVLYWWWMDGNISKEGITADLEAFKAKGLSGVIIFDATGFREKVPVGKYGFMSPEWNEMFKFTLSEASRLGLTVSLNPVSGYCFGGAWVKQEEGFQHLFWVESQVNGPVKFEGNVFTSDGKDRLQTAKAGRVVAVMALPELPAQSKPAQIRDWEIKSAHGDLHRVGGGRLLKKEILEGDKAEADEQAIPEDRVINLTARTDAHGNLSWEVPKGQWIIVALGQEFDGAWVYYPSRAARSGPHANYLDPKVTQKGVEAVVDPLRKLLSPEVASALRYIHEDSLEVHDFNWTANFVDEFRTRRGYDPEPYLPVMAARVVGSRETANRFLYDVRKTIGDLVADNHYGKLTELAHARGLETHMQAGGPHLLMIDPLKCLGRADIPMGEFWAVSAHRPNDDVRFYVKLQSSAAHIYGKRRAMFESFSAMGQLLWKDSPYDLKDCLDRAFCEGANWLALMDATARADLSKIPGDSVGGVPFCPTLTFWKKAGDWFSYMSRCSYLLQQGQFVGDLVYYYGDQVPNQAPRKKIDPARGPGYDYDFINAEALIERLQVKEGRLVLPDGVSYRLLVLPDRSEMPLEILEKLKSLVEAGATVVGPRPNADPGLKNYPQADTDIKRLAAELWGDCDGNQVKEHSFGKGKVFWGIPPKDILAKLGIAPDFTCDVRTPAPAKWPASEPLADFIHRRDGNADIYFVVNRTASPMSAKCQFRVSGKQPELWNPVTARIGDAAAFSQGDGITSLPLELAPHESVFVVFRRAIQVDAKGKEAAQEPIAQKLETIRGPWTVRFDPAWGPFSPAGGRQPGEFVFEKLLDWTRHPDEAVKYYSGSATYKKEFKFAGQKPASGERIWIDLGTDVRNVAEVRLNGKIAGVLWCPPWKLDVTQLIVAGNIRLEIDVVNLWTNRLIGDSRLPEEKRFTRTNGRTNGTHGDNQGKYTPETPLFPSGLLGPVTIQLTRRSAGSSDR